MAEAFEYAIRKDVRNNPIVREIDNARHRELWKTIAVAGLFVGMLLFWAWQQFDILRHGYRLEEMQRERAAQGGIRHRATATVASQSAAGRAARA